MVILKEKKKYLNHDSEWITIYLENVFTPSKMGLLPNCDVLCGSRNCPKRKNFYSIKYEWNY